MGKFPFLMCSKFSPKAYGTFIIKYRNILLNYNNVVKLIIHLFLFLKFAVISLFNSTTHNYPHEKPQKSVKKKDC